MCVAPRCAFPAQAEKRSHGARRVCSDRLVLPVAKKLSYPQRSQRIDSREVSFQDRECFLSGWSTQKRLQSLEYVGDAAAVVLEHLDEVISVFVLAAALEGECLEYRERTGFAHPHFAARMFVTQSFPCQHHESPILKRQL